MRHCTPHLSLLEDAAVAALQQQLAGVQACAGEQANGAAGIGAGSANQPGRSPSLSQLASLLWGLATLGHRPLRLLPLLPLALQCQPGPPSFTALCTIAWSLAVAGCLQQPATGAVAAALCSAADSLAPAGAKKAALLQLHQFKVALQLAAGQEEGGISSAAARQQAQHDGAPAALRLLAQHAAMQPLLAAAASAWQAEGSHRSSKQVSAAQADVAATARTLGLAVHEEHAVVGFSGEVGGARSARPCNVTWPASRLSRASFVCWLRASVASRHLCRCCRGLCMLTSCCSSASTLPLGMNAALLLPSQST